MCSPIQDPGKVSVGPSCSAAEDRELWKLATARQGRIGSRDGAPYISALSVL